jgi:hypothetical protein
MLGADDEANWRSIAQFSRLDADAFPEYERSDQRVLIPTLPLGRPRLWPFFLRIPRHRRKPFLTVCVPPEPHGPLVLPPPSALWCVSQVPGAGAGDRGAAAGLRPAKPPRGRLAGEAEDPQDYGDHGRQTSLPPPLHVHTHAQKTLPLPLHHALVPPSHAAGGSMMTLSMPPPYPCLAPSCPWGSSTAPPWCPSTSS